MNKILITGGAGNVGGGSGEEASTSTEERDESGSLMLAEAPEPVVKEGPFERNDEPKFELVTGNPILTGGAGMGDVRGRRAELHLCDWAYVPGDKGWRWHVPCHQDDE